MIIRFKVGYSCVDIKEMTDKVNNLVEELTTFGNRITLIKRNGSECTVEFNCLDLEGFYAFVENKPDFALLHNNVKN